MLDAMGVQKRLGPENRGATAVDEIRV